MSSNSNKPKDPTWLYPNPIPSEKEEQILADAKQNVWEQLQSKALLEQEEEKPSLPPRGLSLQWALGFASLCLVMGWWWTQTPSLEVIQLTDKSFVQPTKTKRSTLLYENKTRQIQSLKVAGAWEVQTSPQTSVAVHRKDSKQTYVELQRGYIKVSVDPKKKQRFEVQCRAVKVLVKGTVFSIDSGTSWMRVEVWKGVVAVEHKGQEYMITKGQGIRLGLKARQLIRRYLLHYDGFSLIVQHM